MPRPKRTPWTLGVINVTPYGTDKFQARGNYNDDLGRSHNVTITAKTKGAAKAALEAKVRTAQDTFRGGDGVLSDSTPISQAVALFLEKKARDEVSPVTLKDYEGHARRSILNGPLASLTISQANDPGRIETWLEWVADTRGNQSAVQARKIMRGILTMAVRHGAIPYDRTTTVKASKAKAGTTGDRMCKNLDCDYDCGKRHLDTKRSFTHSEVATLQVAADGRASDIGDLVAFLFATGARIAEALHHVAWADLDTEAGTIRIRGTKTEAADRTVRLSDPLLVRLQERGSLYGTEGLIFGTTRYDGKKGQPRDVSNVLKALKRALDACGLQWAGSHTFRRTVATWMDEASRPLSEIANQLGHAHPNVTAGYLARRKPPTQAADIMVLGDAGTRLSVVESSA